LASALASVTTSGRTPNARRQRASRPSHPALNFVEDQERAALVAQPAAVCQELAVAACTPLSPCTGSTMKAATLSSIAPSERERR
jgi:hypothetical protein